MSELTTSGQSEEPNQGEAHWTQVHAQVNQADVGEIETLLLTHGALAVTLSETECADELWEPEPGTSPLWQTTTVTGLFQTKQLLAPGKQDRINTDLACQPILALRWESMAERVWEREWLQYFKPMCIANRLWICPSPETLLPESNTQTERSHTLPGRKDEYPTLILDPGLAFGTGTHPTTRLCLAWLCQVPLEGKTVIDYGCGSGILGIAALILGAKHVIAIDNDPQALLATEQNAKKNGVSAQITTALPGKLKDVENCCDVLIANILAQPLMQLSAHFAKLLKSPSGIWAISGLLATQVPDLMTHYSRHFQINKHQLEEDWGLIDGVSASNRLTG